MSTMSTTMSTWMVVLASVGVLALVCWSVNRRWRGPREPAPLEQRPSGDPARPDAPVAFGREITWLAVRGEDTERIADALDLAVETREPANWAHGVRGAGAMTPRIYIAPPLDGWTLVLGAGLPVVHDPKDVSHLKAWLVGLSQHFGDVQYFACHASAAHYGWARAEAGRFVRGVSVNHGHAIWNEGALTDAEQRRDPAFDGPRPDSAADEGHVHAVAAAWSLDPTQLEQMSSSPGVGVLCKGWVNLDTRAR